MRALICDDYQGIDALRVGELPESQPGRGSVLIDVEAAGVNFADTLMVAGLYQTKPDPPFAPGYEVAGTVVVANHTDGFSPGDRVCGFLLYGGMAERAVLPAPNVTLLPDSVSFDAGATIPGTYGTSYHALVDRAHLQEGETLLVLGAAGGVGLAAVQLGRLMGARVIAAVSTSEKAGLATASGADAVIRYDETPIREGIKAATDGAGVDVVFDPVGGEVSEPALRSTRWGGRYLVIGFTAGDIPKIPLNVPLLKGNALVGVFWGRFTMEEPDRHATNSRQIVEWVEEGLLEPVIQRTFSLDDGRDALQLLADRKAVGRVIIRP